MDLIFSHKFAGGGEIAYSYSDEGDGRVGWVAEEEHTYDGVELMLWMMFVGETLNGETGRRVALMDMGTNALVGVLAGENDENGLILPIPQVCT